MNRFRAVGWTVVARLWGLVAGPLQATLLLLLLSPSQQGLWYAMIGLQRFQALFDLGMGSVMGAAMARDPQRAEAWRWFGIRWHLAMSFGWIFFAGPAGGIWLYRQFSINALFVWAFLVLFSAASMPLVAEAIAIESQQNIAEVASFRAVRDLLSRVASWSILLYGGVWALVVERLVAFIVSLFWWARQKKPFLVGTTLSYKNDVFPLQWRIGASTVGGSLPFAVLVPACVAVGGAAEGGRIGTDLGLLGAFQGLSWALVTPALPLVGRLLSAGKREEAQKHWKQNLFGASILFLGGAGVVIGRDPVYGAILSLAVGLRMAREAMSAWLRAELRPFSWPVELAEGIFVVLAVNEAGTTSQILWIFAGGAGGSLLLLLGMNRMGFL